uniref:SCP domain-containing protein n=1 Tax=Caenorhabditis japonica TaxID=281687 RepID=A0A8R1DSF2_CAEJA
MQVLTIIILMLSYDSCESWDRVSNHIKLMNNRRIFHSGELNIANMNELKLDDTLTAQAKSLSESCRFPTYNDNYRVSFEWVEPDNPIFETTKKLVIVEGKIENALEVVNSYSTPTPNFLEFLVPTQDKVGCAETDCSYVIDNVQFSPLFICLFGPKGKIALTDLVSETNLTSPITEPTSTEATATLPTKESFTFLRASTKTEGTSVSKKSEGYSKINMETINDNESSVHLSTFSVLYFLFVNE